MERHPPETHDCRGLSNTRVQTRTVAIATDELETLHENALKFAAREDIEAYLQDMGEARDDSTCLGAMIQPAAISPFVEPIVEPEVPRTVRAYCEPLLPFLPVEDLAGPEEDLDDPIPDLPVEALRALRQSDPIVDYLREVSPDFSSAPEPTMLRPSDPAALAFPPAADTAQVPGLSRRRPILSLPAIRDTPVRSLPMRDVERTEPEQASVKTSCGRPKWARPGVVSSAQVPSLQRKTPFWLAALMGATIAALLLTSSVFTVEVLASKKAPKTITEVVDVFQTPEPVIVPR